MCFDYMRYQLAVSVSLIERLNIGYGSNFRFSFYYYFFLDRKLSLSTIIEIFLSSLKPVLIVIVFAGKLLYGSELVKVCYQNVIHI